MHSRLRHRRPVWCLAGGRLVGMDSAEPDSMRCIAGNYCATRPARFFFFLFLCLATTSRFGLPVSFLSSSPYFLPILIIIIIIIIITFDADRTSSCSRVAHGHARARALAMLRRPSVVASPVLARIACRKRTCNLLPSCASSLWSLWLRRPSEWVVGLGGASPRHRPDSGLNGTIITCALNETAFRWQPRRRMWCTMTLVWRASAVLARQRTHGWSGVLLTMTGTTCAF